MIAARRKAFLRLCAMVRTIENDLDDLATVKALNTQLLREVLRDENHIIRLRADRKALSKQLKNGRLIKLDAARLRHRIASLERRIERYESQIYIWRCFGDSLAYAYISSFNIKHAFFETTSTDPKQSAGFISGKTGLAREVATLYWAIESGVPAVLSDITNIIRYGDICLLDGPDPVPLEVKSRKGLNQRGLRQAAKLEKLALFLETDRAADFRGAPEVRRKAYQEPYKDHIETLNLCIEGAHSDGYNIVCPERGLVYIAFYGGQPLETFLVDFGLENPSFFLLNQEKSEHNWAPYLPFINSIRDPERLYDFVTGKLFLLVALDLANLCARFKMPGWRNAFVDDVNLAMVFENPSTGAQFALSRQFIGRIGFEFASLDWMATNERSFVRQASLELEEGLPVDEDYTRSMMTYLQALPRLVETDIEPDAATP